ncbi:MAG: hypothetical protein WA810_13800 [Maribacter sp.]
MQRRKKNTFEDLGLDTKAVSKGYRALNKDGSFNVKKQNVAFFERLNIFHSLVSMTWVKFLSVLALGYFSIHLLFANLYLIVDTSNLKGINGITTRSFTVCFGDRFDVL